MVGGLGGSVWELDRAGGGSGERRVGDQGGAAAAACVRRRGRAGVGNARRGKLSRVLREV
jgi:hypothetical protein